jgi:hypothetical protein
LQIGTENRKKVMWAGGLGAVALILFAYELLSTPDAPVTAAQPTAAVGARPVQKRTTRSGKERPVVEARLDPTLDLGLLAETEGRKYAGTGRNIFVVYVELPKPIAPVTTELPQTGPPPPPPPAPPPPITLKFFGFANKPGEPKKAFLTSPEGDVFIAVEGDIVNRRYKVIHIGPTSVEVEDVLYNNKQTIPLTQAPTG